MRLKTTVCLYHHLLYKYNIWCQILCNTLGRDSGKYWWSRGIPQGEIRGAPESGQGRKGELAVDLSSGLWGSRTFRVETSGFSAAMQNPCA